ncbi:TPA: phosphotransacetylase family protein [Candidatus Poribacteria bacterium]|nr:phosphotransacetylase family protein [Candidatus Poribacteria bacterium]
MKTLFITSTCEYCGKTLTALGLGKRLKSDGFKVGYMKMLGIFPTTMDGIVVDSDASVVCDVLELKDSPENISPVIMTQDVIAQAYSGEDLKLDEKFVKAHNEISKDKDVVIVEGTVIFGEGSLLGLSAKDMINRLDANVIVLDNAKKEVFVDDLLMAKDILGDKIVGIIMNQVELPKLDYIQRRVLPYLASKNINTLGVLLNDPFLMSVTIRELAESLGGEIICCKHKQDELVERFSVGAMNVEGALSYFRKIRSKAVITGGDRGDIQLAALETNTQCLILTGNLYPNDVIIAMAEEREVPIMVVRSDTLTVVQRVEDIMSTMRISDKRKIERATQLVNDEVNFQLLYEQLKLK